MEGSEATTVKARLEPRMEDLEALRLKAEDIANKTGKKVWLLF